MSIAATREDDPAIRAAVHAKVGAAKSSFFWAMRLLPKARREAMFAVYAFCREVDDIADEPAPLSQKQAGLAEWRTAIDTLYHGGVPPLVLAQALAGPISRYDLQKPDFLAVIDGMEMDAVDDPEVPSEATLDLYCDRVASAVGRLSVRIFGPWQKRADDVATSLGRALQLTNILRDLDEDARRDRVYLPRELLEAHGMAGLSAAAVLRHPGLPAVCEAIAGTRDRSLRRRRCRHGRMCSGRHASGRDDARRLPHPARSPDQARLDGS